MSKRLLGLGFIVASVLFSLAVYAKLPDQVATHFGPTGEPDGWSSRSFAAFGLPLLSFFMFSLLSALPKIMPRRENYERFSGTYWTIITVIIGFMSATHVVILGISLGWPIDVLTFMLLGIGALFVIMGNLMPRVKSNWMLGIRTPWTLESENVWRETHRVGGRTMVVAGIITMVAAFLPDTIRPWIAFAALLFGAMIPAVYSYILWRREKQAAAI
jgi:uncharacterized membrane protein